MNRRTRTTPLIRCALLQQHSRRKRPVSYKGSGHHRPWYRIALEISGPGHVKSELTRPGTGFLDRPPAIRRLASECVQQRISVLLRAIDGEHAGGDHVAGRNPVRDELSVDGL